MSKGLTEIERLVVTIAKEAQKDNIELEKKVDALKVLAPYYALLHKAKMKSAPEPDGFSLAGLASQIHEAEDDGNGRSDGIQDRASGRN